MSLHLQPVRITTESHLVFANGFLVTALVQLGEQHQHEVGRWFLEAGFGRVDHVNPPTFDDLEEAQNWIEQRLADDDVYGVTSCR